MSEGMSIEGMLLAFDRFDGGAKHDRQFLVKAAAWLRLHPEDLSVLVAKFKQVGDTDAILSSGGHSRRRPPAD